MKPVYLSPNGSDTASGDYFHPVKSFKAALTRHPGVLNLFSGVYSSEGVYSTVSNPFVGEQGGLIIAGYDPANRPVLFPKWNDPARANKNKQPLRVFSFELTDLTANLYLQDLIIRADDCRADATKGQNAVGIHWTRCHIEGTGRSLTDALVQGALFNHGSVATWTDCTFADCGNLRQTPRDGTPLATAIAQCHAFYWQEGTFTSINCDIDDPGRLAYNIREGTDDSRYSIVGGHLTRCNSGIIAASGRLSVTGLDSDGGQVALQVRDGAWLELHDSTLRNATINALVLGPSNLNGVRIAADGLTFAGNAVDVKFAPAPWSPLGTSSMDLTVPLSANVVQIPNDPRVTVTRTV